MGCLDTKHDAGFVFFLSKGYLTLIGKQKYSVRTYHAEKRSEHKASVLCRISLGQCMVFNPSSSHPPTPPSHPPPWHSSTLTSPKLYLSGPLCFKQQVAMQHSLEGHMAEHSPLHGTTRRYTLSPLLKPEPQPSPPSGMAVTKSVPSAQERPWFSPARSMGHMRQHNPPATSWLHSTSECGVTLFPCYPAPNPLYSSKCCQLFIE